MIGVNAKKTEDEPKIKDDQELDSVPGSNMNFKLIIVIAAIAIVAIAIIAMVVKGNSDDSKENIENQGNQAAASVDPNATASTDVSSDETVINTDGEGSDGDGEKGFVEKDPNYAESDAKTTSEKVFDPNDFVKDLEGRDVKAIYSVQSRDYVKTHVSYVAKRALIDEGMEMYWLEVVYKKKKYRVQVPFYYFKDLDDEGIVKVEIEVLNLEGGGQIISYMQVISEDSN